MFKSQGDKQAVYRLVFVIKPNPIHNTPTLLIVNYLSIILRIHLHNLSLIIATRPARFRSNRLEQIASGEVTVRSVTEYGEVFVNNRLITIQILPSRVGTIADEKILYFTPYERSKGLSTMFFKRDRLASYYIDDPGQSSIPSFLARNLKILNHY